MDYSTFSTAALAKILDRSAEGSAEQRAVQEELRRREVDGPQGRGYRDANTLKLFTGDEWANTASSDESRVSNYGSRRDG